MTYGQDLTRQRNYNIMRLRGILPSLVRLIPYEVKDSMSTKDLEHLERISKHIMSELDKIKVKHYTCEQCNKEHGKLTKSKRAYKCDYCGAWGCDLYIVKKENK